MLKKPILPSSVVRFQIRTRPTLYIIRELVVQKRYCQNSVYQHRLRCDDLVAFRIADTSITGQIIRAYMYSEITSSLLFGYPRRYEFEALEEI